MATLNLGRPLNREGLVEEIRKLVAAFGEPGAVSSLLKPELGPLSFAALGTRSPESVRFHQSCCGQG